MKQTEKLVKIVFMDANGGFFFGPEDIGKTCEFSVDDDGLYDKVALVYQDDDEKTSA